MRELRMRTRVLLVCVIAALSLGLSLGHLISLPSEQQLEGSISMLCNNTLQGPYLLSDSNGYVCTTTVIDTVTGCCPQDGPRFSCRGCNLTSTCCNSYEYCVSCCLNPKKTSRHTALRIKLCKQANSKAYSTVFEYCSGRCRHNSGSVVHENAYASEEHHCFSLQSNLTGVGYLSRKQVSDEDDLMDFSVTIGRQGQSCDLACQERGQFCKPSKLIILNKCSVLQNLFACKLPCLTGFGSDQPAQIVSTAPRHLHPGACLFNTESSILSCQGSHPYSRRLCPCA